MAEQYFEAHPSAAHDIKTLRLRFADTDFVFDTDAGVFSRDGLDEGSELMLRTILPLLSGRVLDLGCSWGAVGIIVAKLRPDCAVVMTDINTRAVELARGNLRHNQVRAEVFSGDGLQAVPGRFDHILLNPPIRAGKQVVYSLFAQSAQRLAPGGALTIVIRKQQGAPSAREYLNTLFEEVELLARKKGYHIFTCRRSRNEV